MYTSEGVNSAQAWSVILNKDASCQIEQTNNDHKNQFHLENN